MKLLNASTASLLVDIAAAAIKKIRNRPKAVARRAAKAARKAKRAGPLPDDDGEFFSDDKETSMNPFPQGTQTLTGIAVLVLTPWLAKYGIDDGQTQAIVAAAGTLIGAVIGVLGYLRRKKLPAE